MISVPRTGSDDLQISRAIPHKEKRATNGTSATRSTSAWMSINIENGNEMKIEKVEIFAEKNDENKFEIAEKNLKNQLGIETKIEVKK